MDNEQYPVPVGGIESLVVVGEVLPSEPSQLACWLRVRKVFEALTQPGINTIVAACAEAKVNRSTFYGDIAEPIVVQKLAEWLDALDAVALGVLMAHHLEILIHQQRIARGDVGMARDSTPAARFVQGVLDDLRQQVREQKGSGPSEAAKLLQRFRERDATIRAKRTTVTEELILEDKGTRSE